jgi:hypothetical protein
MAKKEKPKKEKQLDLGLKQSPKNLFYKFRQSFSNFLVRFEIKEYLRNPFTWFVITLSLSFIATQIYILINELPTYPQELPIWQNQTSLNKRLADKNLLFFIPILCGSVLLLGTILSNVFYHKEKFLSKILLLAVLLSVTGLTFSFLKLIP